MDLNALICRDSVARLHRSTWQLLPRRPRPRRCLCLPGQRRRRAPQGTGDGKSWGLFGDYIAVLITFSQVSGLKRRSWPVGRVLSPAALRPIGGRPSIWDHRCRWPRAVYPRTRAGSPRTYVRRWPDISAGAAGFLTLLRAGFAEPAGSLRPLVVSCTTVSPLPTCAGGLFSVALSRGSPRVGVAHRPALRSPDLPRRPTWTLSGSYAAVARPAPPHGPA